MTLLPAIAVTLASIIIILALLAAAYIMLRVALIVVQTDAPLDETLSDVPEGSATSLPADFASFHAGDNDRV